jgi:uncharacterized protein YraI
MMRLKLFSFFVLLILTGCSAAGAQPTPTVDADSILKAAVSTASARLTEMSAAATPIPSESPTLTLAPPTITSTSAPIPAPVEAVSTGNVTVRSEPRKGADNLGGVFFNHGVQVIARNDVATWYYIEWQNSPTKAAWVLAAAIDLKGSDITHLPIAIIDSAKHVIVLPPLIWDVKGTPLPLNTPAAGARTASVIQLAKVRVGPGIGYSMMGTLDPGAVVAVTGHINQNGWLQIEYPSGPGGRGWVAGELVKPNVDLGGLPFYNLLATPVSNAEAKGESPAADPNATPEATLAPVPTLAGPPGVVITTSELNVRSGPASSFALLGTLKLGDPVVVTGLTLNRLWYRIVYPGGPGGYGYVSVQYIRITGGDMTKLPYLNNLGTPLPNP